MTQKIWLTIENLIFYPVTYTRSRLYGHRIYGLFGYLVNFLLVPNRFLFHTIENFGYMVCFSVIWSNWKVMNFQNLAEITCTKMEAMGPLVGNTLCQSPNRECIESWCRQIKIETPCPTCSSDSTSRSPKTRTAAGHGNGGGGVRVAAGWTQARSGSWFLLIWSFLHQFSVIWSSKIWSFSDLWSIFSWSRRGPYIRERVYCVRALSSPVCSHQICEECIWI